MYLALTVASAAAMALGACAGSASSSAPVKRTVPTASAQALNRCHDSLINKVKQFSPRRAEAPRESLALDPSAPERNVERPAALAQPMPQLKVDTAKMKICRASSAGTYVWEEKDTTYY